MATWLVDSKGIDLDYTTNENAPLRTSHLGVSCPHPFEDTDVKEILSASLRRNLYTGDSGAINSKNHEWSLKITAFCSVGFSKQPSV